MLAWCRARYGARASFPYLRQEIQERTQRTFPVACRMQDDAQRQFSGIRDSIIAQLEETLLPEVSGLAQELGYTAVLNTQTPGLLYYGPGVDITDQLIARLNAAQE